MRSVTLQSCGVFQRCTVSFHGFEGESFWLAYEEGMFCLKSVFRNGLCRSDNTEKALEGNAKLG